MAERTLDFDTAEFFLKEAKKAHECGDVAMCYASRRLVAVALDLFSLPSEEVMKAKKAG